MDVKKLITEMSRIDRIRAQIDDARIALDRLAERGNGRVPVICETYIPGRESVYGYHFVWVSPPIGTIIHNRDRSTSVVVACPEA